LQKQVVAMEIRCMDIEDIDLEDLPLHRELLAALRMKQLLARAPPPIAIAIALSYRGFDRILDTNDSLLFHEMINVFGLHRAWLLALHFGLFFHLDPP
jgi:hypothetical protein